MHQSQTNGVFMVPTVFLTSPKVPRVKPRSSGSCEDVEFPIAVSALSLIINYLSNLNFTPVLRQLNRKTMTLRPSIEKKQEFKKF